MYRYPALNYLYHIPQTSDVSTATRVILNTPDLPSYENIQTAKHWLDAGHTAMGYSFCLRICSHLADFFKWNSYPFHILLCPVSYVNVTILTTIFFICASYLYGLLLKENSPIECLSLIYFYIITFIMRVKTLFRFLIISELILNNNIFYTKIKVIIKYINI